LVAIPTANKTSYRKLKLAANARVESSLPPTFPTEIAEAIFSGLRDSARRLERMPASAAR